MENIIKWAEGSLSSHGYIIKHRPEYIQKTPYSSVVKFSTSTGYIYLKQMPPTLSLEPVIIKILDDKFHENVPEVIAINKELNCFLMKDVGNPLRENLKESFQLDLLCKGIKKYTNIQRTVENHINAFIELEVPDWRLEKLPMLYNQLLSEDELLKQCGLTVNEINVLHELYPKFSFICKFLSTYKIPETLVHCDFHDNNILLENNTNNMTIIDWGETVIAHAFFPLISFVTTAAYRYSLKETDPMFIKLLNACFENWLDLEGRDNILEAMLLAKKLWPIYSALGYYRLLVSSNLNFNEEELKSYFNAGRNKGRLAGYFRAFIKTSEGLDPNDTARVNLADPSRIIQG